MKSRYYFIAVAALLLLPSIFADVEDFEDDVLGQPPSEPIYVYTGVGVVANGGLDGQSLAIQQVGGSGVFTTTEPSICPVGFTIGFDLLVGGQPNPFEVRLQNSDQNGIILLVEDFRIRAATLAAGATGTIVVVMSFTPGDAIHVELTCVGTFNERDVSIVAWSLDGPETGSNGRSMPSGTTTTSLNSISFIHGGGGGTPSDLVDNLLLPGGGIASDQVWVNDRNLIDMRVNSDDTPAVYVREVGDGAFGSGEGLLFKIQGDLQAVTRSQDACDRTASFRNIGLVGFAYSWRNLQVIASCAHTTQDQWELWWMNQNLQPQLDPNQNQLGGLVTFQQPPPSTGPDLPHAQVIGPLDTSEANRILAWDTSANEIYEISLIGAQRPFVANTIKETTVNDVIQDIRCPVYAYTASDAAVLREPGSYQLAGRGNPEVIVEKLGTYNGVASYFVNKCVDPSGLPITRPVNNFWLTPDNAANALERYTWSQSQGVVQRATTTEGTPTNLRPSYDGNYLMGWDTDEWFLYDGWTLELLATDETGGFDTVSVDMDAANQFLYVADQTGKFVKRWTVSSFTQNALEYDADGDGRPDRDEIVDGTDPDNPDTDADTWTDGQEASAGTDPLDDQDFPTNSDMDCLGDDWEIENFGDLTTSDGTGDQDGDGFSDCEEFQEGNDPNDADDNPGIDGDQTLGDETDITTDFTGDDFADGTVGQTPGTTGGNNAPGNLPRGDLFPEPSAEQIALFGSATGVAVFQGLIFYIVTGGALIAGSLGLGVKPSLGGAAGMLAVGGFLGLLMGYGFGIVNAWLLSFGGLLMIGYIVFVIYRSQPRGG